MLPSNISPESLHDKFNKFFVHKIEKIRRSFDPDRPIPTNPVEFSGTVFSAFQLVFSSSAFDMMVALTRFFLPRVPHIWMSGANPLQTPRAWF